MAYSPEVIADAILDLERGVSQRKVAVKYGVSRPTVAKWSQMLPPVTKKTHVELHAEVAEQRLRAEAALYRFLQDPDNGPEYLKGQTVAAIATGLGILADKDIIAELAGERRE